MFGCRKAFIILFLFASLIFIESGYAQEVEVSSSLNPVGSGARATGMGGAFIGVADDATAASWNPAGLIQLEKPEISAVYSYFHRKQKYGLQDSGADVFLNLEGENSMDAEGLNYASAVFPFVLLSRNMTVSINYQRMFEMSKEINFTDVRDIGFGDVANEEVEFIQDGFLYTISPALAVQVTPEFYVGATLNLWDDIVGKNAWRTSWTANVTIDSGFAHNEIKTVQEDKTSFKGTNMHFGFLWSINDSLMLGGVYKTPFIADVERERTIFQEQSTDINMPPFFTFHFKSTSYEAKTENFQYKIPASYGLGLSYRHSDKFTGDFDVYRTEWSKFVIRKEDESEVNPLDGQPISEGRLKDTTQVRLGAEYLIIRENYVIPVRGGIFYDPEPATGHLDEYYGASFGGGYVRGKVAVDFAYQFRTGRNLTGDVATIKGAEVDIKQHLLMASTIFYF